MYGVMRTIAMRFRGRVRGEVGVGTGEMRGCNGGVGDGDSYKNSVDHYSLS